MNLNEIFILLCMGLYTITITLTCLFVLKFGTQREVNPLMRLAFEKIGLLSTTFLVYILTIFTFNWFIPESSLWTKLIVLLILFYDMTNDILVVQNTGGFKLLFKYDYIFKNNK